MSRFQIWDLELRARVGRLSWATLMLIGCLANVGMTVAHVSLDRRPTYAARTDGDGTTDLVRLPDPPDAREAQRFVEDLSLRLFGWDEATMATNRAFVRGRVAAEVWERLEEVVPGYRESLQVDVKGRIDATEVRVTRVLEEAPVFRIEVVVTLERSGDYATGGATAKDSEPKRERERRGFLFILHEAPRVPENPYGLEVTGIAPVGMD